MEKDKREPMDQYRWCEKKQHWVYIPVPVEEEDDKDE